MRLNKRMFLAVPLLLATAALADERVTVNVPFSFDNHGRHYPASEYDVRLTNDRAFLVLSRVGTPGTSIFLSAKPTEVTFSAPMVSIRFDNEAGVHELQSLRLGEYEAVKLTKAVRAR